MSYSVKETYLTIQGEGAHSGKVAIFCRFAGCNLWSGLEDDREYAVCKFCDTDFVGTDGQGGGIFNSPKKLVNHILSFWESKENPFVVFTGGEPLLQLDDNLVKKLKNENIDIAVETNGTILPPSKIDWICVSPKSGTEMKLKSGNELKIIYPQVGLDPADYLNLDFEIFSLQPMYNSDYNINLQKTLKYCRNNPNWKLSLQIHKYLNIP